MVIVVIIVIVIVVIVIFLFNLPSMSKYRFLQSRFIVAQSICRSVALSEPVINQHYFVGEAMYQNTISKKSPRGDYNRRSHIIVIRLQREENMKLQTNQCNAIIGCLPSMVYLK